MRAIITTLSLALTACTFNWDHQAPPFPLTGAVPELSSFQKLNGSTPVGAAALIVAPDGVPWAEFCEFWDMSSGNTTRGCLKLHLSRLSPVGQAAADEDFMADQLALLGGELVIAHDDMTSMQRTLTMHRPGDAASADVSFTVPAGKARFSADEAGDVFAYAVEDAATTTFSVFRRDQAFSRTLPLPEGTDPTFSKSGARPSFRFTTDGSQLVTQAPDGHVIVYATLNDDVVDLGVVSGDNVLDSDLGALVCASDAGLVVVPLDGSAARAIGGGGASTLTSAISIVNGTVFYADAVGLWSAPVHGSAAPALVQTGAARFLAQGVGGQIAYSDDAASKYVHGAGSGFIGARQIMTRGDLLSFSNDGLRVHFLEDAATLDGEGDLTSIGVASGAPETLALNAVGYAELPDGRLLAIEDAVFTGTFNRLVIIDEAAQTKHWVTPSTADFVLSADSSEMIVDVVSGSSGYDILRVPTPPR
jgi:hypothetical protein